jgi:hypothetical protein
LRAIYNNTLELCKNNDLIFFFVCAENTVTNSYADYIMLSRLLTIHVAVKKYDDLRGRGSPTRHIFELLVSNLVIHNDDLSFPALTKSTGKGNF